MMTADKSDNPLRSSDSRVFYRGCALGVGLAVAFWVVGVPAFLYLNHGFFEHKASQRALCANELKQIGLSISIYAAADPQKLFPPLSPALGSLMYAPQAMTREYIPDAFIHVCPADKDSQALVKAKATADRLTDDWSYFYTGYVIRNDADLEAFANAYKKLGPSSDALKHDFEYVDAAGAKQIVYRLKQEVWRNFASQFPPADSGKAYKMIAMEVPLVIERLGNHREPGNGANVLYLDGHVKYMRYPGEWPMTEKTVGLLKELDDLGRTSKPR